MQLVAVTEVSEALHLSLATLHHIALQKQKITYLAKKMDVYQISDKKSHILTKNCLIGSHPTLAAK